MRYILTGNFKQQLISKQLKLLDNTFKKLIILDGFMNNYYDRICL